jgi:hypothetical protein
MEFGNVTVVAARWKVILERCAVAMRRARSGVENESQSMYVPTLRLSLLSLEGLGCALPRLAYPSRTQGEQSMRVTEPA